MDRWASILGYWRAAPSKARRARCRRRRPRQNTADLRNVLRPGVGTQHFASLQVVHHVGAKRGGAAGDIGRHQVGSRLGRREKGEDKLGVTLPIAETGVTFTSPETRAATSASRNVSSTPSVATHGVMPNSMVCKTTETAVTPTSAAMNHFFGITSDPASAAAIGSATREGRNELSMDFQENAKEVSDEETIIATPGHSSHCRPLLNQEASAAPGSTHPASKTFGVRMPQETIRPSSTERPTRGSTMAPTPSHLIGHLLRKPGAFAGYRWREELFSTLAYRAAYDRLERAGGYADKRYLEVLKVAADEGVSAVENALEQLLGSPRGVISAENVMGHLDAWRDQEREWRERNPLEADLSQYDALLDGGEENTEWTDAVDAAETSIFTEVIA